MLGLFFAMGATTLGLAAAPDDAVLTPTRDVTLYQSFFGETANGSGQHLFCGVTVRDFNARRALLRFDLEHAIPPGARITGVELTLHLSRALEGSPTQIGLHRVARDWGEGASDASGQEGAGAEPRPGDATWVHTFYGTSSWAVPGGDFDSSDLSAASVDGPGTYQWPATPALVQLAQGWLDKPASNFGIILLADETTNGNAKRFDSREHPNPGVRPSLRVTFVPRCPADFDGDGFVSGIDFDLYVQAFEAGASSADFDGDGFITGIDFDQYAQAFEAGC